MISFKSPISTTWHNANGTHGFECVAPSDCQGTFSFKSSNPKLLAINAAGGRVQVMNNKAFGSVVITATFTPKGADAAHYSTKSITRTIKVVPNIVKIANTESKNQDSYIYSGLIVRRSIMPANIGYIIMATRRTVKIVDRCHYIIQRVR